MFFCLFLYLSEYHILVKKGYFISYDSRQGTLHYGEMSHSQAFSLIALDERDQYTTTLPRNLV